MELTTKDLLKEAHQLLLKQHRYHNDQQTVHKGRATKINKLTNRIERHLNKNGRGENA